MGDKDRIAALEAEVAELKRYVPMLARMAFYEGWSSGGTVPEAILRLEHWTECYDAPRQDDAPEFNRAKNEFLPAAAQALQDSYDAWTSPWVRGMAS